MRNPPLLSTGDGTPPFQAKMDTNFILTKIIATLGPASADMETIVRLTEEGARVFRINFSHGTFEQFDRLLAMVRQAGQETGTAVSALGDLSGPKLRLGKVAGDGIDLHPGDTVVLQQLTITAEPNDHQIVFSTNSPQVIAEIEPGQRLLINDGAVRMLGTEKIEREGNAAIVCQVTVGGRVSSSKGVNLPDSELALPSMTDHDWRCVQWAVENEIDLLALSFVRRADDVRQLQSALAQRQRKGMQRIPVIAKIEKPQALDDLDAIVATADAVMVARGDLGIEMDLAKVPIIQKRIIALAHDLGKPVIVATQMLQSMIDKPSPTRAEVSDVANAIYDGADAVMLSGETAVGSYPTRAVAMMARVASITLNQMICDGTLTNDRVTARPDESRYRTAALAHGVASIVGDLDARLVVTWSQRGGGALYLSRTRLGVPVIAASSDMAALRRMNILYGVIPVLMAQPKDRAEFAAQADELVQQRGWARPGDPIVLVAGEPMGVAGVTNAIWVRYVGDVCSLPGSREP